MVGVGEATIPPLQKLNRVLGLNEAQFVAATQGSFKLGIDFVNWTRIGERYMHTFGRVGKDVEFCDFVSLWRRSLDGENSRDLWDYSLNYQAAKNNKFAKIPKDKRKVWETWVMPITLTQACMQSFCVVTLNKEGYCALKGKLTKYSRIKRPAL